MASVEELSIIGQDLDELKEEVCKPRDIQKLALICGKLVGILRIIANEKKDRFIDSFIKNVDMTLNFSNNTLTVVNMFYISSVSIELIGAHYFSFQENDSKNQRERDQKHKKKRLKFKEPLEEKGKEEDTESVAVTTETALRPFEDSPRKNEETDLFSNSLPQESSLKIIS